MSTSHLPTLSKLLFATILPAALCFPGPALGAEPCWVHHYDVYQQTATSAARAITTTLDAAEFNPVPIGNQVIYDRMVLDEQCLQQSHDLYVSDLMTGIPHALAGGEGGNDASVSRDGTLVAFDRGDLDPNLYLLPWNEGRGGSPRLVRAGGRSPSFSPDGSRLLFSVNGSWELLSLDLSTGEELLVAPFAYSSAWSPDGTAIAYDDGVDVYVVSVDVAGLPTGAPSRLTSGSGNSGQPTWSADGRYVLVHSDLGGDFDIWAIPSRGGRARQVGGLDESDDYDPTMSNDGRKFVYAGYTP